jgi:hypothetical protein
MVVMRSSWPPGGNRSYGPDALGILNRAFADAWSEIAGNFGHEPLEVENARNKLADALLKAADEDGCDGAAALKTRALRITALGYVRSRPF